MTFGARRIGLLGGSFNPAHEGHRYVSLLALKRLRLDEVWWMLTPQNPLKNARDTAPFEERLKAATRVAEHPRIRVTDIERRLGTTHTADTLALLLPRFPKHRFVWLMGADNLVQVSEWKDWRRIFRLVPIAVFSRPPYSKPALVARSARVFAEESSGGIASTVGRDDVAARMGVSAHAPASGIGDAHSRAAARSGQSSARSEDRSGINIDRESSTIHAMTQVPPSADDVLQAVKASLDHDKADGVVVIDLAGKTTIADFMIVASGTSKRHVAAMADHILARAEGNGRDLGRRGRHRSL